MSGEMITAIVLAVFLTGNAVLHVSWFRVYARDRSIALDSPDLHHLFNAAGTIAGVFALLSLVYDDSTEWYWDWSIYVFAGLIALNVLLAMVNTVCISRVVDRDQE